MCSLAPDKTSEWRFPTSYTGFSAQHWRESRDSRNSEAVRWYEGMWDGSLRAWCFEHGCPADHCDYRFHDRKHPATCEVSCKVRGCYRRCTAGWSDVCETHQACSVEGCPESRVGRADGGVGERCAKHTPRACEAEGCLDFCRTGDDTFCEHHACPAGNCHARATTPDGCCGQHVCGYPFCRSLRVPRRYHCQAHDDAFLHWNRGADEQEAEVRRAARWYAERRRVRDPAALRGLWFGDAGEEEAFMGEMACWQRGRNAAREREWEERHEAARRQWEAEDAQAEEWCRRQKMTEVGPGRVYRES